MAHGALYARYSPATVAEAPAWAFAPAPCPLEKTKPRALYWRRGPPPVPVHALVWPPPRGAESAHILLVLCSLCEARRRCYALTGTLGNSYTYLPRFCSPRVRTLFTFRCGSTGVRAGHEVSTPDCKPVSSCHMPWIASRTFGGSVRFGLVRFPLDAQTRSLYVLSHPPGEPESFSRLLAYPCLLGTCKTRPETAGVLLCMCWLSSPFRAAQNPTKNACKLLAFERRRAGSLWCAVRLFCRRFGSSRICNR